MSTALNTTVDYWVGRIRPTLGTAAAAMVLAGADLNEAKKAIGHGGFGQLLDELDIEPRMAQRLMAIARHRVLADPTHGSHLPPSWRTLSELARLDDEELVGAINEGLVHPEMTRAEAAALRPAPPSSEQEPLSEHEQARLAHCEAIIAAAGQREPWWWNLCLAVEVPATWMATADSERRTAWLARLASAAAGVPREARHGILLQVMPDYEPDAPEIVKAHALTLFAGISTGLARDGWTDELLQVDRAATFDAEVDDLEDVDLVETVNADVEGPQ